MVRPDPSPVKPESPVEWAPASLFARFAALLIDWVMCLLITGFFGDPRREVWLPVLILVAEYTFFVGLYGQTPGMFGLRIRCVGYSDGRPIGIVKALARGVLLALFVPALIMDSERRGLHDRLAGSAVVAVQRGPQ
jgi:uncharacterized RDD family membrane protein YckC